MLRMLAKRPPLQLAGLTPAQIDALREQAFGTSGAMSDAAMDCVRTDLLHAIEAGESFGEFRMRLRDSLDAVSGGAQHG